MSVPSVTPEQILDELRSLESERWFEVLDFIGYLKTSAAQPPSRPQPLTAHQLLQSGLVGLWEHRDDIHDSLAFARQLRQQAERRQSE